MVLGKYFEVRYFLNVIVGSAHTLVARVFMASQVDLLQEAGHRSITYCAHTYGISSAKRPYCASDLN